MYDFIYEDAYGDIYGGDEQSVREKITKFKEYIEGLKSVEESPN